MGINLERTHIEHSRADQLNNNLIAMAIRELSDPLSSLIGYAKIIENETNSDNHRYATIIVSCASQLRATVEAIITLQQYDAAELALHLEALPLGNIIQDIVATQVHEIREKALTLHVHLERDLYIRADRERMKLILTNLLTNAIRSSPQAGSIGIIAHQDAGSVTIHISDSGIGLSPDEQEHIFDRFSHGNGPLTRHNDGLGLRLIVVKVLVELHGGRIWVDSTLNNGNTFHISLPRAAYNGNNSHDPTIDELLEIPLS